MDFCHCSLKHCFSLNFFTIVFYFYRVYCRNAYNVYDSSSILTKHFHKHSELFYNVLFNCTYINLNTKQWKDYLFLKFYLIIRHYIKIEQLSFFCRHLIFHISSTHINTHIIHTYHTFKNTTNYKYR